MARVVSHGAYTGRGADSVDGQSADLAGARAKTKMTAGPKKRTRLCSATAAMATQHPPRSGRLELIIGARARGAAAQALASHAAALVQTRGEAAGARQRSARLQRDASPRRRARARRCLAAAPRPPQPRGSAPFSRERSAPAAPPPLTPPLPPLARRRRPHVQRQVHGAAAAHPAAHARGRAVRHHQGACAETHLRSCVALLWRSGAVLRSRTRCAAAALHAHVLAACRAAARIAAWRARAARLRSH
jgi:hypothetical protein